MFGSVEHILRADMDYGQRSRSAQPKIAETSTQRKRVPKRCPGGTIATNGTVSEQKKVKNSTLFSEGH